MGIFACLLAVCACGYRPRPHPTLTAILDKVHLKTQEISDAGTIFGPCGVLFPA